MPQPTPAPPPRRSSTPRCAEPRSSPNGTEIDIVSIELLLDPDSEALVRADWDALAAAGLSSMGAHRSPSNRPHLTLLVRPELVETSFSAAVGRLPLPIELGSPAVFAHGERGVLVRPVVLSEDLLQLHRAVHASAPPGEDAPHTSPGEWSPHITLAKRLRLEHLDEALALLGPPLHAVGNSLRRWDAASRTVTLL